VPYGLVPLTGAQRFATPTDAYQGKTWRRALWFRQEVRTARQEWLTVAYSLRPGPVRARTTKSGWRPLSNSEGCFAPGPLGVRERGIAWTRDARRERGEGFSVKLNSIPIDSDWNGVLKLLPPYAEDEAGDDSAERFS
jgi:hypothetical protein